jgi:hypothetical protein
VKQEPVDLDSKSEDNKPDLVGDAKPPVKDEKEGIKAEGDGEGGGLDNKVEMQDREEVAESVWSSYIITSAERPVIPTSIE